MGEDYVIQSWAPEDTPRETEEKVRAIVKDVLDGDHERFGEIIRIYENRVFSIAWNLTGCRDDAMDIFQECFMRIFRALSSWKGKARFSTWLHRIATNTAIDFVRREARHQHKRVVTSGNEDMDREIELLAEGVNPLTPLEELKRRELRARIFEAVSQLEGKQRECFILRYFADLPVSEVAATIGCGEGTTKRHLFRAREKMKALLYDLL